MNEERLVKLKGQMTLRFNAILTTTYSMYGYKEYAPGVTRALMGIVEESWDIVRGEDKPLSLPDIDYWKQLR